MEVIIKPTAHEAASLVVRLVVDAILANPRLVLGAATGQTMENLYALLSQKINDESVDVSCVTTFNLDEYIGLSADHPQSYHYFMEQHLFSKIPIDRSRTFLPSGEAADPNIESVRYEALIRQAGGIDVQLLGIGSNGHIGFNEPLSALTSRTRPKMLTPETLRQNARYFGGVEHVPTRAITVGIGTILEAKRCILLATGEGKAAIVARAVEGPVASVVTASALQMHPRCIVVVDEAAASELQHTEYYRWIYANEPEWHKYQGH